MRGMRSDFDPNIEIDWSVIKQIWPYLLEYKSRIFLAMLCLIAAKVASVGMPFILNRSSTTLTPNLLIRSSLSSRCL